MNIGPHSFEEFRTIVRNFHGSAAPGVLVGGVMVDLALSHLPPGELFDAVSETTHCLPDAIQLLTPCTTGNGWLKVINLGRYALAFYEKYGGEAVRVCLNPEATAGYPEIHAWYMKLKEKRDQDLDLLLDQIREAGTSIYGVERTRVQSRYLGRKRRGSMRLCPACGEGYPEADGGICRACQGEAPYEGDEGSAQIAAPSLLALSVEQSVGRRVLHDMTLVVPGESKGPAFRKGQVITGGDVCRLQRMGRRHVYVEREQGDDPRWIHEDDAARAFARAMAGEGVNAEEAPAEGKVNLRASRDGMLLVDSELLERFNWVPGVMCAARQGFSLVKEGRVVAGTRAIPLYLPREDLRKAMAVLESGELFRVAPLRRAKAGILVTGTEVFRGMVEDRFIPVIAGKVEALGSQVVESRIVPDDREAIARGVRELLDAGADLIVTTAGLSVDPDDVTRQGLVDAGAEDLLYGTPILPGAMTLLARIGEVRVLGVPACALYFQRTSLDLLLPRLLAGVEISRRDLAGMGEGGLCLQCKSCTFPKCPFGKS